MRYFLPILAVLAVVGGLVSIKASQIGMLINFGEQAAKSGPPPEVVGTSVAQRQDWATSIEAVGSVEAGRGVTISNESPGVVTAIRFESGAQVKTGDILVELDSSVERAQLASATAQRQLSDSTLNRTRALVSASAVASSQLDSAESSVKTSAAEVAALQAQIAKKVVRAPFSGKLGIRTVNLGQYLSPGTPLTTLQSTNDEYVDFTVPQQRLPELSLGLPVVFTVTGENSLTLDGTVAAIDPSIDPNTRSVKVRATALDKAEQLRPGMFVNVKVLLAKARNLVTVPVTAMVYAPYGNSLFVVEDKTTPDGKPGKAARQQFVRSSEVRGDFVAIEEGLKGGETVVTAGAFKLRNGSFVVINNSVGQKPELQPSPVNH
ncbi:MAG: efflux RND transporter periplasmic adaptor subunit [Polyangiaceae bacterium]|nr:efflux RND transporter periplasmic adaptor subunit [Polyangiaceae bacterium]